MVSLSFVEISAVSRFSIVSLFMVVQHRIMEQRMLRVTEESPVESLCVGLQVRNGFMA